jgi:hypothetical protein
MDFLIFIRPVSHRAQSHNLQQQNQRGLFYVVKDCALVFTL